MSPASIASSLGATGGAKKLKKDSVGCAFRTSRVRFVSSQFNIRRTMGNSNKIARTFVSLLLDLKLLCQILLVLPFYIRPDSTVIHEVAGIANLLAVHISLLEYAIFEIFVR